MIRLRATSINHFNRSGRKISPSGTERFPLTAVSLSAFTGDLPFAGDFIFGFSGIEISEIECLKGGM